MSRLVIRPETWMTDAACRDEPGFTELHVLDAVPVCVECPVLEACADYAVRSGSTHVVYAGHRLPPAKSLTLETIDSAEHRPSSVAGLASIVGGRRG